MTPQEAFAYLNALPRFAGRADAAYRPGLKRMEALLEAMDRPHVRWAGVHVAGTNGKGSTASMVAAIATAAGLRTGLHTSPHVFDVSERMRIDGAPAPATWLAEAVARYRSAFEHVRPSFFEATVALSFLYFAEEAVDLAVVEVGLGGRLDATNVLRPRLSVITHVGRDHEALLGSTLSEIAREKAGIIKPHVPVLTAVDDAEALRVIEHVAAAQEAPLHHVRREVASDVLESTLRGLVMSATTPLRRYERLHVGLAGRHQHGNALLALCAAELLFDEVRRSPAPAERGLAEVHRLAGLRGRGEIVHEKPLVVADVAHNPDGLAATLALLHEHVRGQKHSADGGRLVVLFGAMRDKDAAAMARLLAEAGATVWPVPLASDRALSAEELATLLHAAGPAVEAPAHVPEGLGRFHAQAAPADVLLVTGSHQVVGQLPRPLDAT